MRNWNALRCYEPGNSVTFSLEQVGRTGVQYKWIAPLLLIPDINAKKSDEGGALMALWLKMRITWPYNHGEIRMGWEVTWNTWL